MSTTKDIADKALSKLYGNSVPRAGGQQEAPRRTSIVFEKPGGESHLSAIAREWAERQAAEEAERAAAEERQQAVEALEQLKSQKQQEWLQAGGNAAEFRQAWPQMRQQILMARVAPVE